MNPRTTLLLVGAALLATLAPLASAQDRVAEHTVYLHENRLHILPETIHARVGDTLKVTVVNTGASAHNLIFCGDPSSPLERCDERLAFTGMIPANGTAQLTVNVEKAGTFDYWCDIPGHKSGGMTGQLIVEADATKKTVDGPALALVVVGVAAALLAVRRHEE